MRIIHISQDKYGFHFCCESSSMKTAPNGWAVIPDDMETPNLPYGDIVVEEVEGVPTVTSWTPREIPEMPHIPETDKEATADELVDILLGVNENE